MSLHAGFSPNPSFQLSPFPSPTGRANAAPMLRSPHSDTRVPSSDGSVRSLTVAPFWVQGARRGESGSGFLLPGAARGSRPPVLRPASPSVRVHALFRGAGSPGSKGGAAVPTRLGAAGPSMSQAAFAQAPPAGGPALTRHCLRSEGGGRPRDLQLSGQSPSAPEKATQGAHRLHRPSAGAAGAQLRAAEVPERAGPHGAGRLAQPHRHAGQDLVPEPQVRLSARGAGKGPSLADPGGDPDSTFWL